MRRTCLFAIWVLSVHLAPAVAFGFGGGPSVLDFRLFPGDDAVLYRRVSMSNTTDPTIIGFTAELEEIPPGVFVSFDLDSELRNVVIYPDIDLDGDFKHKFPVYVGRTDPSYLADDPDGYHAGWLRAMALYQPPPPPVQVGVMLKAEFWEISPEIPRTSWTITNTSQYDITGGYLILEPCVSSYGRYLGDFTLPAGGSLTIDGQMAPDWQWAIGGILDDGNRSPVIAFDPAGNSPQGKDFIYEVYESTAFPVGAAGFTVAQFAHGELGRLRDGYSTTFAPPTTHAKSLELYAFYPDDSTGLPSGIGGLVGVGTAAAIPEPSSLAIWCFLGAAGMTVGWYRRRRLRSVECGLRGVGQR